MRASAFRCFLAAMVSAVAVAGCGSAQYEDKRTEEQKAADQSVLDQMHAQAKQQGQVPEGTEAPTTEQ